MPDNKMSPQSYVALVNAGLDGSEPVIGAVKMAPGEEVNTKAVASEVHIGAIGGHQVIRNTSVIKASGTTAYDINDVVGNGSIMTFINCARVAGGSGTITEAFLIDSAYTAALLPSIELWLFDTMVAAPADNAAFALTDAEAATVVAVIPFNTGYISNAGAGAAGNYTFQADAINKGFVCASENKNLYGLLAVRNAYVPITLEQFTVRLKIIQD